MAEVTHTPSIQDGAPDADDNRHGYGPTVMACKQEIDELLDEVA